MGKTSRLTIRCSQQLFRFESRSLDGDGHDINILPALRAHLIEGFRIYIGRHGKTVVILLCGGGAKKSQDTDIKPAKEYWSDWNRRQK